MSALPSPVRGRYWWQQQPSARTLRHEVEEAEQVLVRVAEAHPAPDARLVEARRAREVGGGDALVRVPGVQQPARDGVRALAPKAGEQLEPRRAHRSEGGVDGAGGAVALEQRPALPAHVGLLQI